MNKKYYALIIAVLVVILLIVAIAFSRGDGSDTDSVAISDTDQTTTQMNTVEIVTTEISSEEATLTTTETTTDDTFSSSTQETVDDSKDEIEEEDYTFRNNARRDEHYEKHGKDMGFKDAEEYEEAASDVVNNPEALHKTEKDDGDDVYYVQDSNEFVIVSPDGYIRTYFNPDDGIKYYNRQ